MQYVFGYTVVSLQDIVKKSCSGGTPKKGVSEYYEGGNIPWLRTQEVVVGDPERHVIVGAIVIVVTAADPVSGFKRAVKPFDHLLVGAELLRDRIIVCESDYLGNVKLEAVSQLPYELLGGQRISTIAVGNEPKLLGESFYAPESHAHGEDAWPDRAVV